MKTYKEIKKIAGKLAQIGHLINKLAQKGLDIDGVQWLEAQLVSGLSVKGEYLLPSDDVVPKSEVERLEGELIVESTRRKNAVNAYHDAKTEVAREIFEEIEELAKIYTFPVVKNGVVEIAKEPFWCIEPNDLAKLKKKYTEKTE